MSEHIYALVHWVEGQKKYFYVGRTARELGIRFAEHRYAANSTHERFKTDVYEYIRSDVICQIFEEEVLCVCADDQPQDYEDFYVIKLIREGHLLRNEKHGDQKRIAALADAAELGTVELRDVGELRAYRQERARIASERSQALRDEVMGTSANPRRNNGVSQWIEQQNAANVESRAVAAKKAARRKMLAGLRDAEHQRWLAEQAALFEQEKLSAT